MKFIKHRYHLGIDLFHPSKSTSNPIRVIALSPPVLQHHLTSSLSSSASSIPSGIQVPKPINSKATLLSKQEITKINLLLPRLCLSDNLNTAIHLITTALLTNPPPKSLSLPILIHSLTSQQDMTKPMSLLTSLKHTHQSHPHLPAITTMLITSYIKKKRPKEAFKVYQWLLRPDSPCDVEKIVYGVLVNGFCEFGLIFEGLRVLRDMVSVGFFPGLGLRKRVYMSLLWEARVLEAVELDEAFSVCLQDTNAEAIRKVVELLDSMIGNWTE